MLLAYRSTSCWHPEPMLDRKEARAPVDVPLAREGRRPKRSPQMIAIATVGMMLVALVTMILGIYVLATS